MLVKGRVHPLWKEPGLRGQVTAQKARAEAWCFPRAHQPQPLVITPFQTAWLFSFLSYRPNLFWLSFLQGQKHYRDSSSPLFASLPAFLTLPTHLRPVTHGSALTAVAHPPTPCLALALMESRGPYEAFHSQALKRQGANETPQKATFPDLPLQTDPAVRFPPETSRVTLLLCPLTVSCIPGYCWLFLLCSSNELIN